MVKRKGRDIEKEVDKVQDNIEKIEIKSIQKEYKTKIPMFMWFLKILLIIGIILLFITLFTNISSAFIVVLSIFYIFLYTILLYGISKRKRWSLYFGIVIFTFKLVLSLVYEGLMYVPFHIIGLLLLIWHKDYLNQK